MRALPPPRVSVPAHTRGLPVRLPVMAQDTGPPLSSAEAPTPSDATMPPMPMGPPMAPPAAPNFRMHRQRTRAFA